MDSLNSFSSFFYNLVPGAILTILLWILLFPVPIDGGLSIFLIIIFGLFFGFLLQGATLFLRKSIFFGENFFLQFAVDEKRQYYLEAVNILKQLGIESKFTKLTEGKKIRQNLHILDNYLRSRQLNHSTELFAAKSAFWSNICLISFLMLLIMIFYRLCWMCFPYSNLFQILFIILFIFLPFSYYLSKKYYTSQYDAIIKTFLMVVKLDKRKNKAPERF